MEPEPFSVAPLEAIAYLRDKLNVPTARWTDIWQGMHARAFVVAGAQSDALLADFHEAVNRNIAEGRTIAEFRTDFDQIVARHGWSYRGGRNWRSAVIFNTNLRMAYSSGRWAQIQRAKETRPFLRYVAVMDGRTRPEHRAWHDTVLPVDHPWWQIHCPPNGWNCRCSVQSLSQRDLDRYGLKVTEPPASPLVDHTINTGAGPVAIKVPDGIDPGFAYNPGEAGFGRGAQALALEKHGNWLPLDAPGAVSRDDRRLLPVDVVTPPPVSGVAPGDEAGLRRTWRDALGADELVLADPTGVRIHVGQAIVDHMLESPDRQDGRERYFGLIPGIVTNPAEIWVGWAQNTASGRVSLRRRYVKLVDLGKGRTIGLVADADGGEWSGLTFFRGNRSGAAALRIGKLIWTRIVG